MADREKVVEHLYDCLAASKLENVWIFVRKDIVGDAISLLKEQEPGFSPKEIKMYPSNVWACGNCGHVAVGSLAYKAKYCPECGRKVQWG